MIIKVLSKYQTGAFFIISILSIMFVTIIDMINVADPCVLIYSINTIVAFICASMFADWWRVKGSATSIYKWITVLLFAFAYNDLIQLYARYLFVYRNDVYESFLNSLIWEYRSVPKMVGLIYLLTFALWQRFGRDSTYYDRIKDPANGNIGSLQAHVVDGHIKFESFYPHAELVLNAKIILKSEADVPEEE